MKVGQTYRRIERERRRNRYRQWEWQRHTYICLWHTTHTQSVVRDVNSRQALHTRNLQTRQGAPRLVMRPSSVVQRAQWRLGSLVCALWLLCCSSCCCCCCWLGCMVVCCWCGCCVASSGCTPPTTLAAPLRLNAYNSARKSLLLLKFGWSCWWNCCWSRCCCCAVFLCWYRIWCWSCGCNYSAGCWGSWHGFGVVVEIGVVSIMGFVVACCCLNYRGL